MAPWQGLGMSMSTFASHLFVPSEYADAACGRTADGSADMEDPDLPGFAMTSVRTRPCTVQGTLVLMVMRR